MGASESFPMSQLFTWGGQSTGASALASFLPKKSQGWSPSEWTAWISLQSKGLSGVFSNTTVQKHQFFGAQPSSQSNFHIHTWPQHFWISFPLVTTEHWVEFPELYSRFSLVSFVIYFHSSILAWRIPGTEEPGRLQFMGYKSWTWLGAFYFLSVSISVLQIRLPIPSF